METEIKIEDLQWSRYNFLYHSGKNGYFLYNSRTNSFMKVDEELYLSLKGIERGGMVDTGLFSEDLLQGLLEAKALVFPGEDDNYVVQKKYLRYRQKFDSSILGLVVVPTYACNFACPYCYEHDLPNEMMDEGTEDAIVRFACSFPGIWGVQLCWHGGEPLLGFTSMKRLLKKMRGAGVRILVHDMVSNGYLFDEEKCRFLSEYGLSHVQITLDGLPEKHDRSRVHKSGLPTFGKILNNIEMVFRLIPGCHVAVRMNVHQQNREDAPLLYRMLTERWKEENFSMYLTYAIDHGDCKVPCMKEKTALHFAKELEEKHGMDGIRFYPKHKLGGCSADYDTTFIIGPKGEMFKCWTDVGKEERVIGHVADAKLNMSLHSEYIVGTDMFNDEKCLVCQLLPVCDGGCPLYRLEKKLLGKDYDVCPIRKEDLPLLLDAAYEKMRDNK